MTDKAPTPDADHTARLMAVETGLTHFREICSIHHRQIQSDLTRLQERNRQQDEALDLMEEKLLSKLEKLHSLMWSALKWIAVFGVSTLSGIVLKVLNLI